MTDLSAADAKVHILYIVGNVPSISYHMLMDKCLSSLYMDFFTFSKAYSELIAGNLMDVTHLDAACKELNAKISELERYKASSEPSGDGKIMVRLTSENLSINLVCTEAAEAASICSNWRENGQLLSGSVTETLTGKPEDL